MLRWLSIPFFLAVAMLADAQSAPPASSAGPAHPILIHTQSLIDGTSAQVRHGQDILIRGNRIVEVSPAGAHAAPADAEIIELGTATVLPGLIDSHTHIFLQGEVPEAGGYDVQLLKFPASYRVARAIVAARRALEQGFTTIRDVETEGAGYGDVGIKRAINEGYIPGPRMFVATRAISSTGGYSLDDYAPEITVPKGAQIIDGPVEARKAAREQLDHGADWIKVYMTHRSWVDEQGELVSQPTLTVEELKAIVDEAHGWRRKVACHAYNGIGLQRALDGGCDSIEHGLEITDAQIAQMIHQGTWYVPTLAVYYYDPDPPDTPSGKRDLKRISDHVISFKKALHAGVKIAFGTDVGGFVWTDPIAQEFVREVELGMTPMQAIQSATSHGAELLGKRGELGVIAPGAIADVIAVPGDPLQDIHLMEKVQFVMKEGVVFRSASGATHTP
ncbi:MAG TPA: amidohydrolase family protein [Steroidobacteraceae bacterium]|nr:amidohydrolase family protein [Steroidobacteraceae bacterium]